MLYHQPHFNLYSNEIYLYLWFACILSLNIFCHQLKEHFAWLSNCLSLFERIYGACLKSYVLCFEEIYVVRAWQVYAEHLVHATKKYVPCVRPCWFSAVWGMLHLFTGVLSRNIQVGKMTAVKFIIPDSYFLQIELSTIS